MYLSVGVAFSRGHPFRTRIYKNYWFLFCLLFLTVFTLLLMFVVPVSWNDFFALVEIPDLKFLIIICCIAIGHFIISVSFEMGLVENFTFWKILKSFCNCFYVNAKSHKIISGILTSDLDKENLHKDFDNISNPWKNKGIILMPNFPFNANGKIVKTRI